MAIGGQKDYPSPNGPKTIDDVELVAIDPILHPVPDCLTELNPLPHPVAWSAGALDYSGKTGMFSIIMW